MLLKNLIIELKVAIKSITENNFWMILYPP